MKIKLQKQTEVEVKFLKIDADVRYWEDATVNGESYESGKNVPFKNGDSWQPLIDIDSGIVVDWPVGTVANFHFKVCDMGGYALLDSDMNVIAEIDGYVPNGVCHGDEGYGDYIIFDVDANGKIIGYEQSIDIDDWID